MKNLKLFFVLSTIATIAFADDVFYPGGNTYYNDGDMIFDNRPFFKTNGLATTNEVSNVQEDLDQHKADKENPHEVTIRQADTAGDDKEENLGHVLTDYDINANKDDGVSDFSGYGNKLVFDTNESSLNVASNFTFTSTLSNGVYNFDTTNKPTWKGNELLIMDDIPNPTITINSETKNILDNPEFTGLATETWVKSVEKDVSQIETSSQTITINFNDLNEQYFTRPDGVENTTISLLLPEATEAKTGKIIVYVEEIPSKTFHYDFADDNLSVFTDWEDDEKPWLKNENDALWLFTFTSIPGETTWHCDIFKEYEIPIPPPPVESTFVFNDSRGTIVTNITEIGESKYENDNALIQVVLGTGVTNISYASFKNCKNLKSISIPNTIQEDIGGESFYGCTSLTDIIIPESITYIGWGLFNGCSSLTNIVFMADDIWFEDSVFWNCINLEYIELPVNMNSMIPPDLFTGCTKLKEITIPNTVTEIQDYAFSNCRNLTNIIFSDNLVYIGNNVFNNCNSLTNIILPNSLYTIQSTAFKNCNNLMNVTMLGKTTTDVSSMDNHYWGLKSGCKIYCESGEYITVP